MFDWYEALKGLMGDQQQAQPDVSPRSSGAGGGGGDKNFNTSNLVAPSMQFDPSIVRGQVMNDKLGQLGALLMAGGMRQTDAQRAQTLSGLGDVMGNTSRDLAQAYQAQQHAFQTQQLAQEQAQIAQLDQQVKSNPAMLTSLGISPEQYSAIGPQGLMKVIQTNASRDPIDTAYKQALIDQSKQPKIGIIGEDEFGNKTYGDTRTGQPITQTTQPTGTGGTPTQLPGGGSTNTTQPQQPTGLVNGINGLSGQEAITKLKQLDPSVGAEVEQIAMGNQPFPQRMLGTKRGQVLSTLVSMVDPEYNAATYDLRKKMKADYNNSSLNSAGGQIKYANTGIKHGAELFELADKLPNHTNWGPLNHTRNILDANTQAQSNKSGGLNSYKQAAINFMDEVGKALGAGASGEREKLQAQIDAANGPEAVKEVLRTQIGLLRDKIGTMENAWQEGMGAAGKGRKFIDPDAQKALDKIFPPAKEDKPTGSVTPLAEEHHAQSIANAKAAIAKNPANRDAIIQRLRDHGISTEGL